MQKLEEKVAALKGSCRECGAQQHSRISKENSDAPPDPRLLLSGPLNSHAYKNLLRITLRLLSAKYALHICHQLQIL